ncbi:Catabolite control protein A [Pontiella desulfatans]|uniref:Catabolite control protein A n=1 Tax=Pontiella desulfatans TaxID=2750659 RepID=A0A6C2UCU1_PONDE|nr:GntR family transcriptional regulator [Pontiella desulfatans]VGO17719.1 Catabolite control protein A [Pontiella desulfatans]
MNITRLYGHPVTRESGHLPLADQIYDILREEIHAGRWKVDEKMPSMMTIAGECQVSRMPVQQAVERLGAEGYLRQENRSGVYLASMAPEGRSPIGTIGILLLADSENERELDFLAFEQKLVHAFMKEAADVNYQTKVVYVSAKDNHEDLNKAGYLFDEKVKGIISLFPFHRPLQSTLAPDRIPLVFWCEPDHRCAPCIASDYEAAFYHLTNKVIGEGHQHISLVPCPILTPHVKDCYIRGYRAAIREAGLEPHENLLDALSQTSLRDTAGLTKALEKTNGTTCFLSMSLARSEQLISALQLLKRDVPKDISVVSANPTSDYSMPNGKMLSGIGFSPEHEIGLCIQFLRQQMIDRRWKLSTMLAAPFFVEGETLAPPA